MTVILVTGDRKWTDIELVYNVLSQFPTSSALINGYANGLDKIAHVVGEALGFKIIDCPAHWQHNTPDWIVVHGRCKPGCREASGPRAGPIRNRWMLDTYRPDIVLGFHDDIRASKGTRDMLGYAHKKKVPYKLYTSSGSEVLAPAL
jgi:hypothetical protein